MKKGLLALSLALTLPAFSSYAASGAVYGKVHTIALAGKNAQWGAGYDGYVWITLEGVNTAGTCPTSSYSDNLIRFFIPPEDELMVSFALTAKAAGMQLGIDWNDSMKQAGGECLARDVNLK